MSDYAALLHRDGFAIFLFHGVIHRRRHRIRNYMVKHLELKRFEAVLDELTAAGTCVSMDDIVAATQRGSSLPPYAFAVTFDDGFANNLMVAVPALEQRDLPATFYVTSGFVDNNSASWSDLIEYAFELRETIGLELPFGSREARTDAEKITLLDELRGWIKSARDLDPYGVADDIRTQLGITDFDADPDIDRKLTWDQVRELHGHPLFTVGGHGHTHRILERLTDVELEQEIAVSLARQHEQLGAASSHYSYPEGLRDCYSDRVIEALRSRAILCSPSAEFGVNVIGDDLFRLRRITVPLPTRI